MLKTRPLELCMQGPMLLNLTSKFYVCP